MTGHSQLVEIQLQCKIVERCVGEGGAEQQLALVEVAKELKRVWVGRVLSEDRPRLENKLVGAEVFALQEDELVLVREVQRPHGVFPDAEVEGLDSLGARVGAVVAGGQEFGAAEADLVVEDGRVANEHLGRLRLAVEVELQRGVALC